MNSPLWLRHWVKFNAVGAIGIVVQLAALAILKSLLHVEYLLATALAVEIAVLHNFIWHDRWTWKERAGSSSARLVRFNLSAGAVSIAANLLFMRLLAGQFHVHYLLANLSSIAAASLANFLLSDRLVFRSGSVWKWRKRSPIKITERTHEEAAEALYAGRESRHPEAASVGADSDLRTM